MVNGYYINLDERKDRLEHFEGLKKKYPFFKDVERMSAIRNENGAIGCGFSHIKALNKCLESDDEYIMVIEDDFCILNDINYNDFIHHFENIRNEKDWDIIVLTPRGEQKSRGDIHPPYDPHIIGYKQEDAPSSSAGSANGVKGAEPLMSKNHFYEIVNNQTTSGYIIKKSFIPILINTFKKSVEGLLKKLNPDIYSIDQYWKQLQKEHHFYYFKKIFAGQLVGYSNIEKRFVNYNHRFMIQK
jgi:GR25 family glycosyltransferase involved in LPS biosynthesis